VADQWPGSVPRDEMLARVVTRGRRIRLVRRLVVAAAVAGVVTAGAVGYQLGTSGALDLVAEATVTLPDESVAFRLCPGAGEIGRLHRGDRVLLTGTDEDGDWVELRSPLDQFDRVWVPASVVTPDEVAELPVVSCGDDESELALASGEVITTTTSTTVPDGEQPEETTTTAAPTTTVVPGQPTPPAAQGPGPAPTVTSPPTTQGPPPDTTGPSISQLARSHAVISDNQGGEFCVPQQWTSQVSALVTDPSGLQSVRAQWSFVGNGQPRSGSVAMSLQGGVWRATLGPFPDGTAANGQSVDIGWTVRAVDGVGNVRTVAAGPNFAITLVGCFA